MGDESREVTTATPESSTLVDGNTLVPKDFTRSSQPETGNTDAILNGVLGSLVTLVTFLGQVIVITVVSRDRRLRTPRNYFFISLALADLVISIVSMPTWTVYSALGYWPLSQTLCDVWNMVDYSICVVSIYTILFMSADRYLSLKFPFTYRVKRTATRAKISLVLLWLVATVICSLFIWLTQLFMAEDRDPKGCTVYYFTSVPLTLTFVNFALWTPVVGTAFFYCMVFRIAMNAGKTNSMLKNANGSRKPQSLSQSTVVSVEDLSVELTSWTSVSSLAASASTVNSSNSRSHVTKKSKRITSDEKELKAMKTIALLLITFSVCWLPLSVVLALHALKPGYLNDWWMIGSYWLGYINSTLNPVCYAVGNPYFRETVYKLYARVRRRET